MKSSSRVSLIIPTLNEIDGMRQILPLIDRTAVDEIIVVDGNSKDGTVEFARENGIAVYGQDEPGLQAAFEKAVQVTTGDILITFTPDGNSLPELIPVIRDKMLEGYDVVIVSRYLGTAKSEDDDPITKFGNRMFTAMVNLLFGTHYTDVLVGFRAYRRDALQKMGMVDLKHEGWLRKKFYYMNGWELGSCTRAPRLRLRTTEIPGDEPKRIGGIRKLSIFHNGMGSLLQILWDFAFYWPNWK